MNPLKDDKPFNDPDWEPKTVVGCTQLTPEMIKDAVEKAKGNYFAPHDEREGERILKLLLKKGVYFALVSKPKLTLIGRRHLNSWQTHKKKP
jgi:hypothetical protein